MIMLERRLADSETEKEGLETKIIQAEVEKIAAQEMLVSDREKTKTLEGGRSHHRSENSTCSSIGEYGTS
jgi:hypothetical protein